MKVSENYRFYFFLLGLFVTVSSFAQSPCFTANHTRICIGQPVTFSPCSGWTNTEFDFGDGNGYTNLTTTVIYTTPGVKTVKHRGNDLNGAKESAPMEITVFDLTAPTFTVASCEANKVTITLTDNIYDSYMLFWDASSAASVPITNGVPVTNTYASSGTKNIKIVGSTATGCISQPALASVEAYNTIAPPIITSLISQEGQIDIAFDAASLKNYHNYKIFIKEQNGAYVEAGSPANDNGNYIPTYAIQKIGANTIDPSTRNYCIKISAFDQCGKEISDEACSIVLSPSSLADKNEVSWSSAQSFTGFSLTENTAVIPLAGGVSTYTNTNITCIEYCYSIIGRNTSPGKNLTVQSNRGCITGNTTKTPPKIEIINASVENNKVIVTWTPPAGSIVQEFKLDLQTNQQKRTIYRGKDPSFEDSEADVTSSSNCYSISYTDNCGNTSLPSIGACPMTLTAQNVAENNNKLSWTEYKTWNSGVKEYVIEYLDEEGNVYKEKKVGVANTHMDTDKNEAQVIRYRIKAISKDPTPLVSFSNIYEIKQNFLIVLPNAFSPNGDSRNEEFYPVLKHIKSYRMLIYNKWGELIFEGEKWNGLVNGGNAPSGSYMCVIEGEDFTNQKFLKKGTLLLIR